MGLIVTNNAAVPLRYLEWGAEYLSHDPASPTSLILDSDSLVTSGFAGTQTTLAGSYDPNATGNSAIVSTLYTDPQAICGTGSQPHIGMFRVKARVNSGTGGGSAYFRFAWRAGEDSYTTNDPALVSTTVQGFYAVDLGLVTIPEASAGTQSWDGRVEGFSATPAAETMYVDFVMLLPVEAGYGKSTASYAYTPGVITGRDDFNSIASGTVLNARVAPTGGTWVTSGSTTDYTAYDGWGGGQESMRRFTNADSGVGRIAILGSSVFSDIETSVLVRHDSVSPVTTSGLLMRYVDASNYLLVSRRYPGGGGMLYTFAITKVVAGVSTVLASVSSPYTGQNWSLRGIAFASGRVVAELSEAGGTTTLDASDSVLATGGALDDGKVGLLDYCPSGTASNRAYDDFVASTPATEPIVMHSGRQLEIRSDSTIRQSSDGTQWGRPPSYRGSRFWAGPAGDRDRTTRTVVLAHRNNLDAGGVWEPLTDQLTLAATISPRCSVVPRS